MKIVQIEIDYRPKYSDKKLIKLIFNKDILTLAYLINKICVTRRLFGFRDFSNIFFIIDDRTIFNLVKHNISELNYFPFYMIENVYIEKSKLFDFLQNLELVVMDEIDNANN